jgi:hypothetical protein
MDDGATIGSRSAVKSEKQQAVLMSMSASPSRTDVPRVESGRRGRFYMIGLAVLAILLGSSVSATVGDNKRPDHACPT